MSEIQFLTDEEYEAIRRDIQIIIIGRARPADDYIDLDAEAANQVISKLTAYVDQKIKRYY